MYNSKVVVWDSSDVLGQRYVGKTEEKWTRFSRKKKNTADKYQCFPLSRHAKYPGFCKGAQKKWSICISELKTFDQAFSQGCY